DSTEQDDLRLLRQQLTEAELPDEVRLQAERELSRLEKLPTTAAEHHVVRTYFELLLELPWNENAAARVDLEEARRVLDEDHFGIGDVKERILEYLAVLQLNPDTKNLILYFV